VQFFHIYQKKTLVHENKHDEKYKFIEMRGQDNNNLDKRSYSLKHTWRGTKI
jgi:hypothetical protein